jgi:hypothetical protein
MRFSILHLSDLHRDLDEEIQNSWLLESLERDRERIRDAVPKPSLCLLTGDAVFGVKPTVRGGTEELRRQYAQTEEFLATLTDSFFGGDRERIVILPGNHDVSYADAMSSMVPVEIPAAGPERAQLVEELFKPQTMLRWSWAEMGFFRIADEDRYRSRFGTFGDFYARFYRGKRTYPLEPERQHDVFDFPDLNFCVLALNSCFGNDPLHRAGNIHPTCVADGCRMLREPRRSGWTVAAAWHHNLSGPPAHNDYLDPQVLQALIDAGVSLGFHGHQHLQECIDERFRLGPSPRRMTIVGAGTLCSGAPYLMPGVPRSYNVVELDTNAMTGRVNLRAMVNHLQGLPIWGPGHVIATNSAHVDFCLCPPLVRRPADLDANLLLEQGERLIGTRRWSEAADLLEGLAGRELARPLLLRALVELGDVRRIRTALWPPRSTGEAVTIGGAVLEHGTFEDVQAFAEVAIVRDSTDASVQDMTRRIRERRLR